MKNRSLLNFLLFLFFLLSACTSNKPSSPTSSDANQPPPEAAQKPDSAPAQVATPTPPEPPPKPPAPKPVVIPSGTVLTVRLQQALGSKTNQQGDQFEATLGEPVIVNGKTIVPVGAEATGTVTEAHPAGRFKGGAALNLVLDSITILGTAYPVHTMSMTQTSKGKGKRTATMVGGGAGVGALIGGLAGGGKGAAIGALVGGGAGTAGAGLTGNRNITLPAESAVSFQMTASLTIHPVTADAPAQ